MIDFLNQYAAILLDLDGTLYRDETALPGAADLVAGLVRSGKPYAAVTNSSASPKQIAARMVRMGMPFTAGHVYSCAAAAADWVLEQFGGGSRQPRVMNLASTGIAELLEGRVEWVEDEAGECDAVLAAAPSNAHAAEARRWAALQHLRRGARLAGLCADRVYPSQRGIEFGAGSLTALLAYAADVTPVYCGKPERFFFEHVCGHMNVLPTRCLMMGDNLESDIAGACGVGMESVLVLGGVGTVAAAMARPVQLRPTYIAESLAALLVGDVRRL